MSSEELTERLLSQGSKRVDQMDASDLLFYLEYIGGHQKQWKREVLLRLALHFTPRQALAEHRGETHNYADFNSEKEPYQMIIEHLKENYSFSDSESKKIGELIGQMWYDWTEERESLNNKKREALKSKLRKEQNNRCKNCGVKLGHQKHSVAFSGDDEFKPIHEFTSPQMDGEIDHIEPVSQFGHNKTDNYQLLCRFCNQGKRRDVTTSLKDRLEIATKNPENVEATERRSIFYEVTSAYEACAKCGANVDNIELTVRRPFKQGCLTTSNLEAICANCI